MIVVLIVPFVVLAGGLFLILFHHTASAHTGAAVAKPSSGGILGALRYAFTHNALTIGITRAVDWAIGAARGWISHWALAAVKPVARWFDGLTELNKRTYEEMGGLATDTANSMEVMRRRVIPHAVATGIKPVARTARSAHAKAETALAREHALSTTVTRTHAAQVRLNVHYTHAIDVAIPAHLGRIDTRNRVQDGYIEGLRERVGSLEDGALETWKWLNRHRTTAAFGVFTGAVAWALSRLGYGFLRCRSWQNLGRSMKCSDANVLRDLLIGATAIALSTDLVALAKAEQGVIEELGTVVRDFWKA